MVSGIGRTWRELWTLCSWNRTDCDYRDQQSQSYIYVGECSLSLSFWSPAEIA